jgi:chromosome segregation ATPase
MTIEDLVVMTQKGFGEVNERFNKVDKRFNEVDKRFDKFDERFDKIENILIARHDREIELLRDRILQIETKLNKTN